MKKDYVKRLKNMREEAATWRPAWKDIQTYIAPHRGSFDVIPNAGERLDHKTLIDSTPTRALGTLASGMTSGMTSPSRPWFKLSVSDPVLAEVKAVQVWLEDVTGILLGLFARAQIYENLTAVYEELGSFGVGAMMLMDDNDTVFRGRHFTCGEYYIAHGSDNRLNAFAREFYMTVEQIVDDFGIENVSEQVKTLHANNDLGKWIKVCHVICPNKKYVPGKEDSKSMKFSSAYWEDNSSEDQLLRESGFRTFPVMAPRWGSSKSSDVYSKSSPGWLILGDAKMLQKLWRDKLRAEELVAKPPLIKDGNVAGNVSIVPGGVTTSSSVAPNAGVRPAYQINPDFNSMNNTIATVQGFIRAGMFADLFMMVSQADRPDMTAREVVERHEEKLLVLGPLLESTEGGLLEPLIDRGFDIALSKGVIPMPPPELEGFELKVEYISPLAQAQKMVGVTAIEQGARFVGSIASVNPDVLDVVDFDEMTRQHLKMDGVSPKIIKTPEAVGEVRKARADAQAQAQAAQNAAAMVQGAKTLSDTKTGTNSALDQVLAGIQGGAMPQ